MDGVTDEINRPTRVDLNWFRGTEADLYKFANIKPAKEQTYTIQKGDTFKSIAESHSLSLTELLDANPKLLQVGSTLKIPAHIGISAPPVGTETSTSTGSGSEMGGTAGKAAGAKIHTVVVGDTLISIALKYGTTVDAIMAINSQITNRNIIFEGQEIKIP